MEIKYIILLLLPQLIFQLDFWLKDRPKVKIIVYIRDTFFFFIPVLSHAVMIGIFLDWYMHIYEKSGLKEKSRKDLEELMEFLNKKI